MNILAVVGDYYHDEALMKKALNDVVGDMDDVELTYSDRVNLVKDLSSNPDLVILGAENRLNPNEDVIEYWLSEDDAEIIAEYVRNGGGWFAWHSGMASYENNQPYINMLGGFFQYHPDEHQMVTYLYQAHPLFEDKQDAFQIKDEHYFIKHGDEIEIFLKSESVDGESIAGWTRSYGNGHVACYAPAHLESGMQHQDVQNDMKRLMEWCLS
ncbi:ThuA domain-containing protein [Gracilibacillus sp. D59]|uniref:ThuA domain-containing protein n=1 Tax=Gracilibacillus sp. D59 TaxID=3457434 RepID=UPI003FCDD70B